MKFILDRIKMLWIGFWLVAASLLLFIPITAAAFFSRTGNLAFTISKGWAWLILLVTGVRPEIRGKEHIRKGQSYIIISNHQSHFDILALVTQLGIQFRWIIKKELRKVPLFGYALYASRNIYIDRSDREKAIESIRQGVERLPAGTSVMFFAEGTRSPDGRIGTFK
ncbi:MAG: 1-acyl-sn-glycerol-3-phosphate acyltransferase, partial [Deltaproteobacteria bacterium]|nr:1-acyl-sn-glycerol-3-phosphate acyltransferase [Deltaproteobacteria bacterium]